MYKSGLCLFITLMIAGSVEAGMCNQFNGGKRQKNNQFSFAVSGTNQRVLTRSSMVNGPNNGPIRKLAFLQFLANNGVTSIGNAGDRHGFGNRNSIASNDSRRRSNNLPSTVGQQRNVATGSGVMSSSGGGSGASGGSSGSAGNVTSNGAQPVTGSSPSTSGPTSTPPSTVPFSSAPPSASAVPEPNSLLLWALASFGIVSLTRKRNAT